DGHVLHRAVLHLLHEVGEGGLVPGRFTDLQDGPHEDHQDQDDCPKDQAANTRSHAISKLLKQTPDTGGGIQVPASFPSASSFLASCSKIRSTGPISFPAAKSAATPNCLAHKIFDSLVTIGQVCRRQEGTRAP